MLRIGIDLDNTITATNESKKFFTLFTSLMSQAAIIYIITNRDTSAISREKTIQELDELIIIYDELVITDKKEEFILKKGITVYFDDTDEYFQNIPESVVVFKIRESGNFDFKNHKWLYSDKTGIDIDNKK